MNLKKMILSVVSVIVLISLFIMIFLLKALMLSDIPVRYTLSQLNSMNILIMTTTFVLFLLLIFTKDYLKYTLLAYSLLLVGQVVITINNHSKFDSSDIMRLDQLLILMLLYPLISGFFMLSKKKNNLSGYQIR